MPVLDEGNGFTLEIDAVDTCGARHALAYRSCANGARGRIWLLENLREVQAKYGIALGDVLVVRCARLSKLRTEPHGCFALHPSCVVSWHSLAAAGAWLHERRSAASRSVHCEDRLTRAASNGTCTPP